MFNFNQHIPFPEKVIGNGPAKSIDQTSNKGEVADAVLFGILRSVYRLTATKSSRIPVNVPVAGRKPVTDYEKMFRCFQIPLPNVVVERAYYELE